MPRFAGELLSYYARTVPGAFAFFPASLVDEFDRLLAAISSHLERTTFVAMSDHALRINFPGKFVGKEKSRFSPGVRGNYSLRLLPLHC